VSVWLRYRKTPDADPVDVRFDPMPEPERIAAFLTRCATRLGLRAIDPDPDYDRMLADRAPRLREEQERERRSKL